MPHLITSLHRCQEAQSHNGNFPYDQILKKDAHSPLVDRVSQALIPSIHDHRRGDLAMDGEEQVQEKCTTLDEDMPLVQLLTNAK